MATKKVAIVHDWLYGGGAERVVYELHQLFPDAPIYTSYCNDKWRRKLDGKVATGWLQHWPFSKLRKFLPVLRIWWFEHLDLSGYDLVISSSGNGEAKGVKAGSKFKPGQTHICYCHTPTHFYWRHYEQYMKHPGFGLLDPLVRVALRLLVGPLRKWDRKASERPDYFIANSTHIQQDIKKYYGRESVVINPPVDVERFVAASVGLGQSRGTSQDQGNRTPTSKLNESKVYMAPDIPNSEESPATRTKYHKARHGFVTVSRQVPQKRIDIIVAACSELGLPLTVVGNGPENARLRSLAGPSVVFDTNASDQDVAGYVRSAEAFIFAALDDFGIAPPEAMAAGTPVIAYKAGGALDYVKPGATGEFFKEQTVESLVQTLKEFDASKYDHDKISQSARQFSGGAFRSKVADFIQRLPL